jgi:hypothetical protein
MPKAAHRNLTARQQESVMETRHRLVTALMELAVTLNWRLLIGANWHRPIDVAQWNLSGRSIAMPLQRGEVQGYDFDRMIVEFTMFNQGKVVPCAISTAAMDDLESRRDVRPDQRVDQFVRLREVIEERASRKFFEEQVQANRPVVLRSNDFIGWSLHSLIENYWEVPQRGEIFVRRLISSDGPVDWIRFFFTLTSLPVKTVNPSA